MKRGLIIVLEIIAVLAVLVFIKTLLNNLLLVTANRVISFVLYFVAVLASFFIYRLNMKNN